MNFLYRLIKFLKNKLIKVYGQLIGLLIFKVNKVSFKEGVVFNGIPEISIQGNFKIGKNFSMNSSIGANPIGRTYRCMFIVRRDAILVIGDNVGISGTTIVCQKNILIGNYVKIGGNVCIYDTDFHSLNPILRQNSKKDQGNTAKQDVVIEDNVFIGAHSTILKGVTIGANSIIGASSLVSKDIPKNEIWAGNPAKFIKKVIL